MDDESFRQLLNQLGYSWEGYRKVRKGVKKRIRRHMEKLGCRDIKDYLNQLNTNSLIRYQCEKLMAVPISRFMRDKKLWQALINELLMRTIQSTLIDPSAESFKVWSAGCANGEEAYSFKIAWDQLERKRGFLPKLELLATDLNLKNIEKAKAGTYPNSSFKEMPENFRSFYFHKIPKSGTYAIKSFIKEGITWKTHHLLYPPQKTGFHIIFLRNNVLTYFSKEKKAFVIKQILPALLPGGLFIIGADEKLPIDMDKLIHYSIFSYIFLKKMP